MIRFGTLPTSTYDIETITREALVMFVALELPRVPSGSVDWLISKLDIHDLKGVHSVSCLVQADAPDERIQIVRLKKITVDLRVEDEGLR